MEPVAFEDPFHAEIFIIDRGKVLDIPSSTCSQPTIRNTAEILKRREVECSSR
jgi:hypothetical protein